MDVNIDKYWKTVGVEMLLSYAQLLNINTSEEEMYDMVFEEEYNTEEAYDYFEPKLIACAKAWDIIRNTILKYWENPTIAQEPEFVTNAMKQFHDVLNVTGEYCKYFDSKSEVGKTFLKDFMLMRTDMLKATSINSFCEYLLIFVLKCLQTIESNITIYEYIAYWAQGAILFKGFKPIIFKERHELLEFINKMNIVAKRLKAQKVAPKDWMSQNAVQEIVGELVLTSEEWTY
ncbi:hypothetical protein [Spiroplasma culicicola]|uniref:Uncharacterized protein n=1 Tax=Spiroplasma culicicola AES-1 TaxID=1276246 RepID=W6AG01_9MOLU|nr:hypothetical protein [Spiroplasma culicicola]AHI52639.1 hypothetical protein SCULI_v1c02980 [Spiroplasma culicicola AES-1]